MGKWTTSAVVSKPINPIMIVLDSVAEDLQNTTSDGMFSDNPISVMAMEVADNASLACRRVSVEASSSLGAGGSPEGLGPRMPVGPPSGPWETGPLSLPGEIGPPSGPEGIGPPSGAGEIGPPSGPEGIGPPSGAGEIGPPSGPREIGPPSGLE